MPSAEAASVAAVEVPTRTNIAANSEVGRIQPKSGDHGEGMAVAGVDCDPSAASAFTEAQKIA
jgi:hypothetical protein